MVSRERSCDFSLTLSQPLLRLGFVGDLAPGSPGFLQVHPGFFSKFSWLLTSNRILSPCLSSPQIRSHGHWFPSHFLSTPAPLVIGALSLSKLQLRWTTPWAPNPRSSAATHHQGETFQLVVNLKPPVLPPPEPPPTGFRLNPCSTDELLVTDCVFLRPPPKPPWLYWTWFKLAWMVFVKMSQQRFVFLVKKGLIDQLVAVDTSTCNHCLFQISFNWVFNFDIIETTYSRNELAAVAYLIRNWIEKKTVDSLLFIVIDRGRKTLQPWKFVCRDWLNSDHLAPCHSFTTNAYSLLGLLGFNCCCFLSTCLCCFKDFSLISSM